MSGGTTRQTQTTTQSLPANQQTNVDALLRGALDYYNSGGRTFYPGDMVANFDPAQLQGQQSILDYATGTGQDFINQAIQGNSFFLNPENIMNPNNIPGFQGSVDALTRGYSNNLLRNILPSVRGGATSAGQFGGSASGIGQALATSESNKGLSDSLANLYLGAYNSGLGAFNAAQDRAPALFALGAAPGQLMSGVGEQRQTQAQNETNADVSRWNFAQNEPMVLLSLLQQLTGQAGTYGGTARTDTRQQTAQSPLNTALGAGLTLASLWNPMTSLFAGLPGIMSGAAGGAGAPSFSTG